MTGSSADLDEVRRLRERYRGTGDVRLLEQALKVCRHVTAAGPGDGAAHLEAAALLGMRYEHRSQMADLDEALRHLHRAAELIPDDDVNAAAVYTNIVGVRTRRYLRLVDGTELQAGIEAAETALRRLTVQQIDASSLRGNLAGLLRIRFERYGEPRDLNDSIAQAQRMLEVAAPANPMIYSTLAGSLSLRFRYFGAVDDLIEAVKWAEVGVAHTPVNHPDRFSVLGIAGGVLKLHFEHTGVAASLTAAETYQRELLTILDTRHTEAGVVLLNMAYTLLLRHDRVGSRDDIDELMAVTARALGSPDPLVRAEAAACRARGLYTRVGWLVRAGDDTGARAAARAAVTAARQAVEMPGADDFRLPDRLFILANAWDAVYELTGDPAAATAAEEHLTNAIRSLASDDARRPHLDAALASHLVRVMENTADTGQLPTATRLARSAVADAPHGGPIWEAAVRVLLAVLLLLGPTDQDGAAEVVTLLERLARSDVVAPATLAALGLVAGDKLLSAGNDGAARAYTIGVDALPAAAWHGLDRVSQEAHLSDVSGIGSAAAAGQLHHGEPERAVETLEAGRNLLWAQMLDARGEYDRLERDHPDLARRLVELSSARNPVYR